MFTIKAEEIGSHNSNKNSSGNQTSLYLKTLEAADKKKTCALRQARKDFPSIVSRRSQVPLRKTECPMCGSTLQVRRINSQGTLGLSEEKN